MPQNFVTIYSTNYKVLTQPMQLNAIVMKFEMGSASENVP
jgi:hypothetical protein